MDELKCQQLLWDQQLSKILEIVFKLEDSIRLASQLVSGLESERIYMKIGNQDADQELSSLNRNEE